MPRFFLFSFQKASHQLLVVQLAVLVSQLALLIAKLKLSVAQLILPIAQQKKFWHCIGMFLSIGSTPQSMFFKVIVDKRLLK